MYPLPLIAKPTAPLRGAPGKSAIRVQMLFLNDHASFVLSFVERIPVAKYPVLSIWKEAAALLGSPSNADAFTHSVGPSSVVSSSSFLQELNADNVNAQAKIIHSQLFLFINYLNLVYTIFNLILGLPFSVAILKVFTELYKLDDEVVINNSVSRYRFVFTYLT